MKQKTNILTRTKQWILSVVKFRFCKITSETEKYKRIKSLFETYFDGCYGVDAQKDVSNTYAMGICKLNYNEKTNILTVYLRRPGLLIGKQGRIIEGVEKYLECKIKIIEITKF